MRMIEMHIVQSFPVTCLNRDDLGSPKSAVFGGVERARVSSQCWKRAIRTMANSIQEDLFGGKRTKYVMNSVKDELTGKFNKTEESAGKIAVAIVSQFGEMDSSDNGKIKTLLYLSPAEISNIVKNVMSVENLETMISDQEGAKADAGKKKKKKDDDLGKVLKSCIEKGIKESVKDFADIALFGRMVANDHSLTIEGAANFSHAISTHKVSSEIDFFSAVDDLKPEDTEGAGHIGTLEFNSACYYRYVGINLDLLADKDHLSHFSADDRKNVLKAFIKACLMANPTARKNSMFGYSFPSYVLGLRRTGQPLSLANAFEKPISSHDGYEAKSQAELIKHFDSMNKTWGILNDKKESETESKDVKVEIPKEGIDKFIEELLKAEV